MMSLSLQGARAASKHATHCNFAKTWASDVTQELGQFENWKTWSATNVCSPSCGGVCGPLGPFPVDNQRSDQKLTPGDQLDLFSANRSRIDGK